MDTIGDTNAKCCRGVLSSRFKTALSWDNCQAKHVVRRCVTFESPGMIKFWRDKALQR